MDYWNQYKVPVSFGHENTVSNLPVRTFTLGYRLGEGPETTEPFQIWWGSYTPTLEEARIYKTEEFANEVLPKKKTGTS